MAVLNSLVTASSCKALLRAESGKHPVSWLAAFKKAT